MIFRITYDQLAGSVPMLEANRAIQRGFDPKAALLPVQEVHQEVEVYITVPRAKIRSSKAENLEKAH